jgi:hypothetical protein
MRQRALSVFKRARLAFLGVVCLGVRVRGGFICMFLFKGLQTRFDYPQHGKSAAI